MSMNKLKKDKYFEYSDHSKLATMTPEWREHNQATIWVHPRYEEIKWNDYVNTREQYKFKKISKKQFYKENFFEYRK